MRALFNGFGLPLGMALLGGVLLVAGLHSAARLVEWLPLSRSSSTRIRQWLPVLATFVVLVYIVAALQWLLGDSAPRGWAVVAVLFLVSAACWRAIRDAIDGLFLRATGACRTGDYVQLEHLAGRIRRLGWRFLVLETSEGHVATVPYSQVTSSALRRLPEVKHGLLHLFFLDIPSSVPLPVVKRHISVAALLCPWCVPKRNARVRTLEQGTRVEVTLSLVDADHAAEAESVVRESVQALRNGQPSPAVRNGSQTDREPPTARTRAQSEQQSQDLNRTGAGKS